MHNKINRDEYNKKKLEILLRHVDLIKYFKIFNVKSKKFKNIKIINCANKIK